MNSMNLAEIWDISLKFLYTDKYVSGLERFLQKQAAKRILDCACGTGFPSIELLIRGFDVTLSDGSLAMLRKARESAERKGLKVPLKNIKWGELNKKFSAGFDCVLCRGNSFVYADSWNREWISAENALKEMRTALENFYDVLKPGGIFYVDVASQEEFRRGRSSIIHNFEKRKINGKELSLLWVMDIDRKERSRTWTPKITEWQNGVAVKSEVALAKSYLLTHYELKRMISQAGFSGIQECVKIYGEENYDVFVAQKPLEKMCKGAGR
ncbi:MAG: class I SAM-dependent methyltransferase [Candidatus Diapherotrites archaeon]